MKYVKVMVVFGTRPEAIKMAPVIKELQKRKEVKCTVCVTAQHREMLDQVLSTYSIIPDYDLDIMEHGQTLSGVITKALNGIDEVIKEVLPDIVLVHGDTNSTLAGSLAAFYNRVYVGHVEAGLRTWNKYSPFPEEINRQITGIIADFHFAPTELSKKNLLREGKPIESIFVTGNTAIDALKITTNIEFSHPVFDWIGESKLILLTAHRRENIGQPMEHMFNAINRISMKYENVKVIYPIHPNLLVRKIANKVFDNNKNVKLIEPLDVFEFHHFMKKSYLILTDSGGIQEEAPYLGKPVLVMRDTTERPEGIKAGTLKLAGTNENTIFRLIEELLIDDKEYKKMSLAINPYGDGFASIKIVDAIIQKFIKEEKK